MTFIPSFQRAQIQTRVPSQSHPDLPGIYLTLCRLGYSHRTDTHRRQGVAFRSNNTFGLFSIRHFLAFRFDGRENSRRIGPSNLQGCVIAKELLALLRLTLGGLTRDRLNGPGRNVQTFDKTRPHERPGLESERTDSLRLLLVPERQISGEDRSLHQSRRAISVSPSILQAVSI